MNSIRYLWKSFDVGDGHIAAPSDLIGIAQVRVWSLTSSSCLNNIIAINVLLAWSRTFSEDSLKGEDRKPASCPQAQITLFSHQGCKRRQTGGYDGSASFYIRPEDSEACFLLEKVVSSARAVERTMVLG